MKKGTVLIIGAGGVGNVVTYACSQVPSVFQRIVLASRRIEKCQAVKNLYGLDIDIEEVDADNVPELIKQIGKVEPELVINVALPYQDLHIMEACLETGVHYLDTANYEPPDEARFCYEWQWSFYDMFKRKGLMALLGCGFDPGVTNIFLAYLQKHFFDEIYFVDIMDCNAGSHGQAFATNFNPEINIREVTQPGRFWENGRWIETPAIIEPNCVHLPFDFPEAGPKEMYLLYHEEMQSLVKHLRGLKRIRFWMTFGQEYLTHLRVLQNVGMTRIDPVSFQGKEIIPLQFLKSVLPEPSSLGKNYTGKTNIGCLASGIKDGAEKTVYIYNVCDHAECFRMAKAQAISFTTGVPAMIGAMMIMTGQWLRPGVFNTEEFDPDLFMKALEEHGLPWVIQDNATSLPSLA